MQVRIAILGLFLAGALAGCGEEAHVIGTIDVSEVGGWSPSPSFRLIAQYAPGKPQGHYG